MKKLLLATAVATLSITAAQATPTVYGKAFLTTDYYSGNDIDTTTTESYYSSTNATPIVTTNKNTEKGTSSTSLNSNTSRIGFKGAEGLTANTDLVYQLEYGIDVDADNNGKRQFYSRDTYLGLSNKQYGTLVAGRLTAIDDNINYVSQAVGQFDNSFGGASWDGNRANNAMAYFSPNYSGLQFMGMYVMDENNGTDLDALGVGATTGSGWGAGVNYTPANQPFKAGATYIQSGDFNTARVSGAFTVNPQIGLGALYEVTDANADKKENVFSLSGTYKTATPWTAYAQADFIKNLHFTDGTDSSQFVVGGKYAFNPATTGHIYAGYRKVDGVDTVNTDVINSTTGERLVTRTSVDDSKGFGIGAGLEYKF